LEDVFLTKVLQQGIFAGDCRSVLIVIALVKHFNIF